MYSVQVVSAITINSSSSSRYEESFLSYLDVINDYLIKAYKILYQIALHFIVAKAYLVCQNPEVYLEIFFFFSCVLCGMKTVLYQQCYL